MTSWNEDAKAPSSQGRKPAKNAGKPDPRQKTPSMNDGGLPDWGDGARVEAASNGVGLWQRFGNSRLSQGLWIFLLALGFLCGLAYFIILFIPREEMVPLICVAVTGYESNAPYLPQNSLAVQDMDRASSVNAAHIAHSKLSGDGAVTEWEDLKSQVESGLKNAKPSGPSRGLGQGNQQNVIIFLSLHLATNAKNETVMLFPSSEPLQSETWRPLKDLLKLISDWRTEKFSECNCLVVLDCGKQRLNPYLAITTTGLTTSINEAFEFQGDDHLFGLVSQSDDQQNWVAPELNGSCFGYAFSRALSGQIKSQNVTLEEFATCIISSVVNWTKTNRIAVQRPVFIKVGNASAEFPLLAGELLAGESSAVANEADIFDDASLIEKSQEQIEKDWAEHSKLEQGEFWKTYPQEFARFEHELLYAEQAFLMGLGYTDCSDLLQPSESTRLLSASLAMRPGIREITTQNEIATQTDPVEQMFQKSKQPKQADDEPKTSVQELNPWAIRSWLLQKCLGNSPAFERDHLKFADQQLTPSAGTVPDSIEAQFIRMLDQNCPWDSVGDSAKSELNHAVAAAIACRFQYEQLIAALPKDNVSTDLRALYQYSKDLSGLDQTRRETEDLIFSGRSKDLAQATESLSAITKEVEEISLQIHDAEQRIRNGEWQLAHFPGKLLLAAESERTAMNEACEATWINTDDNFHFYNSIDSGHLSKSSKIITDANDATQITGQRDRTAEKFIIALQALQSCELTGEARNKVRRYAIDFLQQQSKEVQFDVIWNKGIDAESAEDHEKPVDVVPATIDYFKNQRAALMSQLRGLSLNPQEIEILEGPGQQNDAEELRQTIMSVENAIAAFHGKVGSDREIQDVSGNPSDPAYQTLLKTEQLIRLISPISPRIAKGFDSGSSQADQFDVVELRRNLDSRSRVLLQAHRVLDDFWGTDSVSEPSRKIAWFGTADHGIIHNSFDEAVALTSKHPGFQQNIAVPFRSSGEDLSVLLQNRAKAASVGGITINTATSTLNITTQTTRLTQTLPETELEFTIDNNLPNGSFVVLEPDDNKNTFLNADGARQIRMISQGGAKPAVVKIGIPEHTNSQPQRLEFRTYFRGHVAETSLQLKEENEKFATLHTERPNYSQPTVTVLGDPPNLRPKVMFVLDCSGSMGFQDVENREGGPKQFRGKVCRTALRKTLEALDGKSFDVGLTLLGHRAYWMKNQEKSGEYSVERTKLAKDARIPASSLNPDKDVEVRFELGPLDRDAMNQVLDQIEESGYKNGSQTPLYLAMETALNEFVRVGDKQSPRFLVVITDGVNQVSDVRAEAQDRTFTNVRNVLESLNDAATSEFSKVKCHLAYLDPSKDGEPGEVAGNKQFDALKQEFEELSDKGRGGLFTARDSSGIESELLKALGWIEFEVQESGEGIKRLDSTINVRGFQAGTVLDAKLIVRNKSNVFGTKELTFEGGEKLTYVFQHNDRQTVMPEFEPNRHQTITVDGYQVKALTPIRLEKNFSFPISIQRLDSTDNRVNKFQFTRRPVAYHAEILGTDVKGDFGQFEQLAGEQSPNLTRLSVYDRIFSDGTAVPVVPLTVPAWTQDSVQAKVSLWFRMKEIPSDSYKLDIPLNSAVDQFSKPRTLDGTEFLGKFSVQKERTNSGTIYRVRQEDIAKEQYFDARIELSRPADRTDRYFYVEPQAAVVHEFHFNESSDVTDIRLRIMLADDFKKLQDTINATADGAFAMELGRQD